MTANYLVFDTETTGLPKRPLNKFYSSFDKKQYYPISDIIASSQSRLVSICWIVHDKNNTIMQSRYYIIKPDGFIIPEDRLKFIKLVKSMLKKEELVFKKFLTPYMKTLKLMILKHELLIIFYLINIY